MAAAARPEKKARKATDADAPVEEKKALPLLFTMGIGSLPRPAVVRDLVGDEVSRESLDDSVRFAIRLQEVAGLDVISDGEWRRHYMGDFLRMVGGFERAWQYQRQGDQINDGGCPSHA